MHCVAAAERGDESLCCKLGLKVKMGSEKIANVA